MANNVKYVNTNYIYIGFLGSWIVFRAHSHHFTLFHRQQLPLRRGSLSDDRDKYLEGVRKMSDMSAKLRKLQDEVAAMQPKLQDSQVATSKIMAQLQQVSLPLQCRGVKLVHSRFSGLHSDSRAAATVV